MTSELGPPLDSEEVSFYRRLFSKYCNEEKETGLKSEPPDGINFSASTNSGDLPSVSFKPVEAPHIPTTEDSSLIDGWISVALVPRLLKAAKVLSGSELHAYLRRLVGRLDADSNNAVSEVEFLMFLRSVYYFCALYYAFNGYLFDNFKR